MCFMRALNRRLSNTTTKNVADIRALAHIVLNYRCIPNFCANNCRFASRRDSLVRHKTNYLIMHLHFFMMGFETPSTPLSFGVASALADMTNTKMQQ